MLLSKHLPESVVLDDLCRTRTAAELQRAVSSWFACFQSMKLESGNSVALLMRNRVEFIELVLAGLQYGLTVVPLNWHLQENEVKQLLDDCCPQLIISESMFTSLLADMNASVVDVDQACDEWAVQCDFTVSADSPAGLIMLYTGGTTGLPKGVMRQGYADIASLFEGYSQLGTRARLTGSGPHLVTGPLYHAAPLYFALYDFINGAPLVIMPSWDAEAALSLIHHRSIRCCHFVPTQMIRMLRLDDGVKCRYSLASLELVLHGAAAMPEAVKHELLEWFGPILLEYWGGSESGICCRISSEEWLQKPGSVGRPVGHYAIRILDAETGSEVTCGEEGLIQIRHQAGHLPFSYRGLASEAVDGWFDLGDVGYQDGDGFLYLCDRQKNKIIRGGVNIYPAEIEKLLLALPELLDVAVIGLPDGDWGEKVVAVVQASDAVDSGWIKDAVQQQILALSAFKRPQSLYVVESLERMPNGKLRLAHLLERLQAGKYRCSLQLTEVSA